MRIEITIYKEKEQILHDKALTMTTTERNEQIALMLKLKPLASPYRGAYKTDHETDFLFKVFFNDLLEDESWYAYPYPKFDREYNWQMEVVEFIERLHDGKCYSVRIEDNKCEILVKTEYALAHDKHLSILNQAEYKKDAVFLSISDFAKLYNEGKL